jgi:hypothetical protein
VVESAVFLLRIAEVLDLNLALKASFLIEVSVVYLSSSRKIQR